MPSLGLVANVYQEVNALPGWLETHLPFFDDVRVTHAGPQGKHSTDGTIELLEKWRIPVDFDSIDEGFGAVRTRTIRRSPCDYVMLLDADERFYQVHRIMVCTGRSTPPSEVDTILHSYDFRDLKAMQSNWENIGRLGAELRVDVAAEKTYDQGERLREVLEQYHPDAVIAIRRHWHDFSFRRPTQNWHEIPDWQLRIVKNDPSIYYDPGVKVHEHLVGAKDIFRPDPTRGPYFDHFHFTMKRMEPEQRAADVRIYNAIHEGRVPPVD
jgi:hypothetical protein